MILSQLQEAAGEAGRLFKVRVIKAGKSLNNNVYPAAVLREAVDLFKGARVIVKADAEHLQSRGKDPRAVLGRLVDPAFVDNSNGEGPAIEATFEAISANDPMVVRIREAVQAKMGELFGLSIDAKGVARSANGAREVTRLTHVNSVDLIVEPGAGGRVLDVLEAAPEQKDDAVLREALIKRIKAARPKLLENKDVAALTDGELETILTEALAAPAPTPTPQPTPQPQPTPADPAAAANAAIALFEARSNARDRIRDSGLPKAAQDRVAARLAGLSAVADLTEAKIDALIQEERTYIGQFSEAGRVTGLGNLGRIEIGETRGDKVRTMLEAFFDPGHKDHRHAQSFKECYIEITGDTRVTGLLSHCDEARLREALDSASFGSVLGNSITRRMIADYRTPGLYDVWRQLVNITPVNDFRTQERTRFGGYGDLPIVAEKAAYAAVTSPTDEKATYAVVKRGGTESVSLEMIKNDDVGVIRQIPTKLSRAAKRTLAKFVLDIIVTNPVVYDGLALFHATHANLGTAALAAASYAAGRLAMIRQKEKNSLENLGIGPKFLLVPSDLEETARNLFVRGTNLDPTFVQTLNPTILPVWYWADANDWALAADPLDIPSLEVGFLDGNQEPELLIQDSPVFGSVFSNDVITYKIRHIYGGNVTDFRGLYKAVVP